MGNEGIVNTYRPLTWPQCRQPVRSARRARWSTRAARPVDTHRTCAAWIVARREVPPSTPIRKSRRLLRFQGVPLVYPYAGADVPQYWTLVCLFPERCLCDCSSKAPDFLQSRCSLIPISTNESRMSSHCSTRQNRSAPASKGRNYLPHCVLASSVSRNNIKFSGMGKWRGNRSGLDALTIQIFLSTYGTGRVCATVRWKNLPERCGRGV